MAKKDYRKYNGGARLNAGAKPKYTSTVVSKCIQIPEGGVTELMQEVKRIRLKHLIKQLDFSEDSQSG